MEGGLEEGTGRQMGQQSICALCSVQVVLEKENSALGGGVKIWKLVGG